MSNIQPTSDYYSERPLELKMELKHYGCQRVCFWCRARGGVRRRVGNNLPLLLDLSVVSVP